MSCENTGISKMFSCEFFVKRKWICFSQSKKKIFLIACVWTESLWKFRELRLLNLGVSCVTVGIYCLSVEVILSTSQQLHTLSSSHRANLLVDLDFPKAPQSLEMLPLSHTDFLACWNDISSLPCPMWVGRGGTSNFLTLVFGLTSHYLSCTFYHFADEEWTTGNMWSTIFFKFSPFFNLIHQF